MAQGFILNHELLVNDSLYLLLKIRIRRLNPPLVTSYILPSQSLLRNQSHDSSRITIVLALGVGASSVTLSDSNYVFASSRLTFAFGRGVTCENIPIECGGQITSAAIDYIGK